MGGRNNNAVECKPAIMAINCGWLEACERPNGRVAWGWRMRSRSITIIVVIVILLVYNHWWRCVMINLRIWWSAERDEKEKEEEEDEEEEEVRTRWSISQSKLPRQSRIVGISRKENLIKTYQTLRYRVVTWRGTTPEPYINRNRALALSYTWLAMVRTAWI